MKKITIIGDELYSKNIVFSFLCFDLLEIKITIKEGNSKKSKILFSKKFHRIDFIKNRYRNY